MITSEEWLANEKGYFYDHCQEFTKSYLCDQESDLNLLYGNWKGLKN